MIAYNSNEGSSHTGAVWFLWYAADSAHVLGQLVSIDYSDSTPDVAFTYDRLGRQLTVTDILGTRTNVYDALNLLEERHPDGTALVRSYDAYGRAAGIALGTDYAVSYGYDSFGRFSTVAVSNGATFTYSYVPNSSLLSIGRLREELAAWERRRNQEAAKVDWQFRTPDARIKLISLYPPL
ncbi:MAG: hypothetical protein J6Y19_00440 [Kiritimatiellae bacterium]|nr:hypothetical protein [Kiritimatiellia bacterium]